MGNTHSLEKNIRIQTFLPLVLIAQIFSNAEDNEVEPQKQYPLISNLSEQHKNGKHVI